MNNNGIQSSGSLWLLIYIHSYFLYTGKKKLFILKSTRKVYSHLEDFLNYVRLPHALRTYARTDALTHEKFVMYTS
jgi:hypothetical protein